MKKWAAVFWHGQEDKGGEKWGNKETCKSIYAIGRYKGRIVGGKRQEGKSKRKHRHWRVLAS